MLTSATLTIDGESVISNEEIVGTKMGNKVKTRYAAARVLSRPYCPHLVVVLHVLGLPDGGQLAVPPVPHAGVQLPVQRLEILQRTLDLPPSASRKIFGTPLKIFTAYRRTCCRSGGWPPAR